MNNLFQYLLHVVLQLNVYFLAELAASIFKFKVTKILVTSAYDTNVENQIWCFCYNLLLSNADREKKKKKITDEPLKM